MFKHKWRLATGAAAAGFLAVTAYALDHVWEEEFADRLEVADAGLPLLGAPEPQMPPGPAGAINFRVYHVDYDTGNDAAAGTSPSAPWKHAPGDPAATGIPKTIVLKPGDIVRFRAGVHYRGNVVMPASGSVGVPITYTGSGYGTGKAILDGSDELISAVPCSSQAACGGAPHWQNLMLLTFGPVTATSLGLFDGQGLLFESQFPTPSDPFWRDKLADMLVIPVSQAAQVAQGILVNADLADAARYSPNARVLIWSRPNVVLERAITSISGDTIHFDATGVVPYLDRDGRAAVLGAVNRVTGPGLSARIGANQAIAWPNVGGGEIFLGHGRGFFDIRGRSNLKIAGFTFQHGTSGAGVRQGIGIANYGSAANNLIIENNTFQNFSLKNGQGVINMSHVSGLTIRNNVVDTVLVGSGVRLGSGIQNLLFERNRFRRVGRTGLMLTNVQDAVVRNNVFHEMNGVHGNGISAYRANRNILIESNCVYESTRPLTFEGENDPNVSHDITIRGNIFITGSSGRAAIYGWGALTRLVRIENNVALSPIAGISLHGYDDWVTVVNNIANYILVYRPPEPNWDISDNDSDAHWNDRAQYTLSPNGCSGPGFFGPLTISAI